MKLRVPTVFVLGVALTVVCVGLITSLTLFTPATESSVEIGLAELSPNGEAGGYAVPASGEAPPTFNATCTLTVTDPITTGTDGSLTVAWNTGNWERLTEMKVKRCSLGSSSCSDSTWASGAEWVTVVNPSDRCDIIADAGTRSTEGYAEAEDPGILGFTARTVHAGGGGGESCTFPEDGTSKSFGAGATALAAGPYKYRAGVDFEVDVPSTLGYGSHEHTHTQTAYCADTVRIESAPSPELIGATIPPYAYAINSTAQFSVRVTNYGSLPAGASSAIIDVDTNNDGVANWSSNVIAVAGLASDASVTIQNAAGNLWTAPATPQTVRVRVRVDTAGVVSEANETNNASAWTDVAIQEYDVTARGLRNNGAEISGTISGDSWGPFAVGSALEGLIKVRNQKAFPVPTAFQNAIQIRKWDGAWDYNDPSEWGADSGNREYLNNAAAVASLTASEDKQVTMRPSRIFTSSDFNQNEGGHPGADYIGQIWADSNNNLLESGGDNVFSNSSGNNDASTWVNFKVVRANIDADPVDTNGATAGYWGPMSLGQSGAFRFTLRNESNSCTSENMWGDCNGTSHGILNTPFDSKIQIDFQVSGAGSCTNSSAIADACIDVNVTPVTTTNSLAAQASVTINPTWTPTQTGTFRARVWTDSTSKYPEYDENDNRTDWQQFTVGAGNPSVVLQGCNATLDASACSAGSAGWKTSDFNIATAQTLKLRWTSYSTTGGSCSTSFGGGSAVTSVQTGVDVTEPVAGSPATYNISCNSNPPGTPGTDSLTVTLADVSIDVDKRTVRAGDTVELRWNTGPNNAEACSVSSTGTSYSAALSSHQDCTVGATCSGSQPVVITQSSIFTINCGTGGTDTVEVNLVPQIFES